MVALQQVSERVACLEHNYTQLPHLQVRQECREVRAALRALGNTNLDESRSLRGRVQSIVMNSTMNNLDESERNFLRVESSDDRTGRPSFSTKLLWHVLVIACWVLLERLLFDKCPWLLPLPINPPNILYLPVELL